MINNSRSISSVRVKKRVQITVAPVQVVADLNDTGTAEAIWQALPISGRVNLWGDEIYFSIPVNVELEDGKEVVECGALGYWPQGRAFCIFFGKTPASLMGEIRPASAVNVFGRVLGDASVFKMVKSGAKVTVEKEMSGQ
jgi:hypothetical protein